MKELVLILPEVFLALTLAFVIAGEITHHGEQLRLITATSLLGLAGAFTQTVITYKLGPALVFSNTLSIDGLSLFFKLLFIALSGLALVSVGNAREIPDERKTEFSALILAATLAMCLVASSADLLLAFLSLQFLNVLSYFLAGFGKRSVLSAEAGVKYMAFGAVSGALFVYGLAILFAFTHTLNMYEMHRALLAHPLSPQAMIVAFMLVFLSLAFQVGAFPMYLATPDVIEGAPTPISAFLSVGPRAAGFALGLRFLIAVFAQGGGLAGQWQVLGSVDWTRILSVVAGVTMALGALLAFRQTGAKRLIGWLVVSESGFLWMGLLVLDQVGVAAVLYNFVVELIALVGSFFALSVLVDELKSDRLSDLRGVLKRAVPESIGLILFLLCLVGVPPFPGFLGKFALIGSAVRHQRTVLAGIAIAAMGLSTAAVARLAFSLVGDFRKPAAVIPVPSFQRKAFFFLLVIPMALVGIFADFVFHWAGQSLGFIFW